MEYKYNIGDVLMMTETKGGYDFDDNVTGKVTVIKRALGANGENLYCCEIEGYDDPLSFFENELVTIEEAEDFKPGDIVIIHGDKSDYTDHLDGVHGVVVAVDDRDCTVVVPNEHMAKKFMDWKIWKWNMTKC